MVKKKVNSVFDLAMKCRNFAIAKDKTRPYLMGVYHDAEAKRSVTTNGHVLALSKILFQEELQGLIIDKDMLVVKREFPKWQNVLPIKFSGEAAFMLPEKLMLKGKSSLERSVYFHSDGQVLFEKKENFVFALDSANLKPIIGCALRFKWNNELSPVLVELSEDYPEEKFIIMPVKV
jgi:DNA polymerase III sliding clamp (beta) subunit (PCNA family)